MIIWIMYIIYDLEEIWLEDVCIDIRLGFFVLVLFDIFVFLDVILYIMNLLLVLLVVLGGLIFIVLLLFCFLGGNEKLRVIWCFGWVGIVLGDFESWGVMDVLEIFKLKDWLIGLGDVIVERVVVGVVELECCGDMILGRCVGLFVDWVLVVLCWEKFWWRLFKIVFIIMKFFVCLILVEFM